VTGGDHILGDPAELAALYLTGALEDDECATFEAHLVARCPDCERELRALTPVFEALARLAPPVTPSALSRVVTLAAANESLGELSEQQMQGVGELVAAVEESLPDLLHAARDWEPYSIEGMYVRPLRFDGERQRVTALVRLAPGTQMPPHQHDQGEQCVVLHGELAIGHHCLRAGEYRYWKPGEPQPAQSSEDGCLLLVSSPLD
jgi:anti-sigma factor ChrR (cupin superfamily)